MFNLIRTLFMQPAMTPEMLERKVDSDSITERQKRFSERVEATKQKMGLNWVGHPDSIFQVTKNPKVLKH